MLCVNTAFKLVQPRLERDADRGEHLAHALVGVVEGGDGPRAVGGALCFITCLHSSQTLDHFFAVTATPLSHHRHTTFIVAHETPHI
jgi:hypothetical protein